MHALLKAHTVDLCSHILLLMHIAYKEKITSLLFGGLITKLVAHFEVPPRPTEPSITPQGAVYKRTVSKSMAQVAA